MSASPALAPSPSPDSAARAFLGQLAAAHSLSEREQSIERQLLAQTGEAYRWGRLDRRTQHFNPHAASGDAAIYESQDLMHRRTRSEALNNAQIKRIVEALTDLVVGTGVQTFADPIAPWVDLTDLAGADFDEDLRYALECDEQFERWFQDPQQFDIAGKLSGPEMQRLAFSENVQVGDALVLECVRPGTLRSGVRPGYGTFGGASAGKLGAGKLPLCYQILERDQLDWSQDRPGGPVKNPDGSAGWENRILNGIELDRFGREVAFHIYDAHPHDPLGWFGGSGGTSSSTRILARRVHHLFAFQRPSQSIGVTWLHAIGQTNFDRDKFIGAEIQTAAKSALLLLVARLKNLKANLGLDDGDGSAGDEYGNQEMKLGMSPIALKVDKDDTVEMVESNRPNPDADSFIGILDHDTAAGVGLSYYTLTGRYDKTNYTSVRGALLSEDTHIRPLQNWFARRLVTPIRQRFNALAIGMGMLENVSPSEFLRDPNRYLRVEAMGPGRELLDPEAETNAAQGKLRSGLTTLKIECARRGLHWIKVLRQKALENRVASLLEVVLDFSKGQGGQVDKSTSQEGERGGNTRSASQRGSAKEETNA